MTAPERTPYRPPNTADWTATWELTCAHCARMPGCAICEAMIESICDGAPWPEGGFATDPGAGVTCLSYEPSRRNRKLSRQELLRFKSMKSDSRPPVCGGCAATKGTDASQSLHTRRDFDAAVKDRRVFICHETGGYCGGWLRAVLRRN